MRNRETVRPTSAHTARLVWLLASLGLGLAVVMLAVTGFTVSRINTKRHDLAVFQTQMATVMAKFDRNLTLSSDVLTAALNGEDDEQDGIRWIQEMESLISRTQKVADKADVALELTVIQEQYEPLGALYGKCVDWNCVNARLFLDLPASEKKVERSLSKLREALEKIEGRLRLQLAIKTRRLDRLQGAEAGRLAQEIVGEMSLPSSLAVAKTELADLALLCERLSREKHIDHLTDIKDNQLKSTLERLQRSLGQIEQTKHDTLDAPAILLEGLESELFGEGYTFDQAHQRIVPGKDALFSLTRDRLNQEGQRRQLVGEILSRMQQLRAAGHRMNADIHVSTATLVAITDRALAQAWQVMLVLCLTTSGIFVFLASRITRAVKDQLIAIEVANKQLDRKAHDLAEANQSLHSEITERKRVQQSLKDERDLSESLIASLPGVFYMLDEQRGMVKINKAFAKAVGYSCEQVLTMNAAEFFSGADQELVAARTREVFEKGQSVVEADLVSSTGTATPYYLTGVRVNSRETNYLIGVGIDITDRRLAEQKQARLLDELQQVNGQLKDFAYVVSHDLKAPLRGIKLLAEWLCADYGDQLGDDAKENLDLLQSRVGRMHNLIEGVLQYSRVGRIKEDVVKVDLNEAIHDIIDAIAPPDHIEIAIDGSLPTIEGEETRINQVFQNLLSNAVKYMDKPAGKITVGCRDDGDAWTFSVRDNGPGIEERYFERIFKIFQTLTPRDEYESTGVGLTLVKKIVELYGGKVWVESEVEKGSTFFFTLPKQESQIIDMPILASAGIAR